ncbi:MAG: alkaline phosphatase, partial [Bacteroidales bacterium]|nr:alkaline phosphatase [Bacteroidales bacterium]
MNKKIILWLVVLFTALQAYAQTPKYVFLFIGDGMGLAQVSAAEAYLSAKDKVIGNKYLSFSRFPIIGLCTTFSADSFTTCSSAAATALACGSKTNNGMVNITPSGDTLWPISYKLRDAGYKIGIATTVSIDHATPAAFYAASSKRSDYYDIGRQLPLGRFNFFAGGGFLSPKGKKGDQPDLHELVSEAGYTIVRRPQEISNGKDKVVLFQSENKGSNLPFAIRREQDDLTLTQITEAAIRV